MGECGTSVSAPLAGIDRITWRARGPGDKLEILAVVDRLGAALMRGKGAGRDRSREPENVVFVESRYDGHTGLFVPVPVHTRVAAVFGKSQTRHAE